MRKKRILLIDDEPSFTRMLKLNLEETGAYEVRAENRGTQGLTSARQFKPDLILLDVILPDMNGGDVAFQIEADRKLKNTPIVFLTAAGKKEDDGNLSDQPESEKFEKRRSTAGRRFCIRRASYCPGRNSIAL